MEPVNRLALQLDAEVAAVITAMRANAKWAVVPGKYNEDDQLEAEPHIDDFRMLRKRIFEWSDWSQVQPFDYLAPFLRLVREPDVSGPITGVALTALWRLLSNGALAAAHVAGAAEAVNAIVEHTTQCKFEATSPASDEVVLFNILQVLQAVVQCPAGVHLTDESVCKAYQAAFMLGNLDADLRSNRGGREVSELLTHYSRQIMGEITTAVFEKIQTLPSVEPGAPLSDEDAAGSSVLPHMSSVVAAAAAEAAAAKAAAAAVVGDAGASAAATAPQTDASAATVSDPQCPDQAGGAIALAPLPAGGEQQDEQQQQQQQQPPTASAVAQTVGAESRSPGAAAAVAAAAAAAAAAASSGGAPPLPSPSGTTPHADVPRVARYGHGLACAVEVLSFLADCISQRRLDSDAPGGSNGLAPDDAYATFGLSMAHRALLAAGPALAAHDALLALVHRELLPAMAAAAQGASLGVASGVCQLAIVVWQVLGPCSMLQLEAVVQGVLLRLADGKGVASPEQQEAALEGILDLCRCPGFLHAAYLSCDCRLERSNLFEELAALLCKTAFPGASGGAGRLGPLHLVSLQGLLALLGALSEGLDNPPPQLLPGGCPGHFVDVWGPVCAGLNPALDGMALLQQQPQQQQMPATALATTVKTTTAPLSGVSADAAAQLAAFEKGIKTRAGLAVEHFNKSFKKGVKQLQANKLLPELSDTVGDATTNGSAAGSAGVSEDELARCLATFLRVCPGLSKASIGELLGEPDPFHLKVLEAFTATFEFSGLNFDAGLRIFLEAFRLPGEAQKIDRIINAFGRAYFSTSPDVFAHEDAAYVLAYSVIMLNTDRHNSQVKKKMEEAEFCRNLRGVNAGQDFPRPFLSAIYHSICSAPLRMSDTVGGPVALSGPSAAVTWGQLADRAHTQRGVTLVLPAAVRHRFDAAMFHLVWGQAVHALGAVLEQADTQQAVAGALEGLQAAARLAAHYDVEGVADSVLLLLSRYSAPLNVGVPKPRVVFGRDVKACAAVEAMFAIATRYGDCVRSSWGAVVDLVLRLERLELLPPALDALMDADVWGVPEAGVSAAADGGGVAATPPPDGTREPRTSSRGSGLPGAVGRPLRTPRQRRAAAGAARRGGGGGGGFLRSVTQLIALQEPEFEAKAATQAEKEAEAVATDVLHVRCAVADVFAESRFLTPEALQALVAGIIAAPGQLPRPGAAAAAAGASVAPASPDSSGQRSERSGGSAVLVDWEAAELCLDLLLLVLLRNRDRLALVWPPVFEHLTAIMRGKGVDGALVAAAAVGLLRLCQRLLPCKPEAAEPLLRGLQLVPGLDPEVAWLNATVIAAEMLALVQVASPHIRAQWAWASACSLVKMTSVRPEAFPVSLEALQWVVCHGLTPLNYVLALEASVWFIERAALEHPKSKERCLSLLPWLTGWLEGWSASLAGAGLRPEQLLTFSNAKSEFWLYLVEMLARLAEAPDADVRAAATTRLRGAVVAAEGLGVLPGSLERGLRERLLPPLEALSKKVAAKSVRDMPYVDVTAAELVSVVSEAVLLHLPALLQQPGFPTLWLGLLSSLSAAAGAGNAQLSEASAAALRGLLLRLHEAGVLQPGWSDAQHNLWQQTWHAAARVSPSLSPAMLAPASDPTRAAAAAAQVAAAGLGALPVPVPMPGQQQQQPLLSSSHGAVQLQGQMQGLQLQPPAAGLVPLDVAAAVPDGVTPQLQQPVR